MMNIKIFNGLFVCFFCMLIVSCSNDEIEATSYIKDEATKEILINKRQKFYKENKNKLRNKRDYCRTATKEESNTIDCIAAFREGAFLGFSNPGPKVAIPSSLPPVQ